MIEIIDLDSPKLKARLDYYLKSRPLSGNKFLWAADEISKQILGNKSFLKTLCIDEKIVSFIIFNDLLDSIEILYLESHPLYLRGGHMTSLLKALIRDWPNRSLWLDVHENNEAGKNLYLSLGFVQTGLRRDYYKDGGSCLQLTLKPIKGTNS